MIASMSFIFGGVLLWDENCECLYFFSHISLFLFFIFIYLFSDPFSDYHRVIQRTSFTEGLKFKLQHQPWCTHFRSNDHNSLPFFIFLFLFYGRLYISCYWLGTLINSLNKNIVDTAPISTDSINNVIDRRRHYEESVQGRGGWQGGGIVDQVALLVVLLIRGRDGAAMADIEYYC